MKFLDFVQVHLRSGAGGAGSSSFRRERHLEYGGPDGGDGGRGGDVWAEAVPDLNTLVDFRYGPHVFAANGRHGMGKQRAGAAGKDAVLHVPAGTEILADDRETVLADLTEPGTRTLLAPGGAGGHGNLHFKSSTNRAPRRADPGEPGIERTVWLRLKLIADAGLLGLPNAGKSTFLSAVSNARPKVADYPFTTLEPHLGMVRRARGDIVIADIPGLVEGAHEGRGIGDRFLGHVERCAVLLHLLDATSETLIADHATMRAELAGYGHGLAERPSVTALTKIDALTEAEIAARREALAEATGATVLALSSASGAGVEAALDALFDRAAPPEAPAEPSAPWRP